MPHNESKANRAEPVKPSKLSRIKSNAVAVTWIAIPVVVTGGLMYLSVKMTKTQLETAQLNLETAKLNAKL